MDFCISKHERYWPLVFLHYDVSTGFDIKLMLASQNELQSVPTASIFWKRLLKIGTISF